MAVAAVAIYKGKQVLSTGEVEKIQQRLNQGENPRDIKMELAKEIRIKFLWLE